MKIIDVLTNKQMVISCSEGRRVLAQGVVRILQEDRTQEVLKSPDDEVSLGDKILLGRSKSCIVG